MKYVEEISGDELNVHMLQALYDVESSCFFNSCKVSITSINLITKTTLQYRLSESNKLVCYIILSVF
ncbi:hypothetical protein EUGRSUZ_B00431 [Eucalyptus grandis]|uniref:Uncharacterized protein n=2 Tax=Eucalyptus grandis TaxID=71139 RepID=A0ACC3LMR5_EUCGR|nr:hypothetical protein EUGRSUZ_B00431 [Eucalyptus grandis]